MAMSIDPSVTQASHSMQRMEKMALSPRSEGRNAAREFDVATLGTEKTVSGREQQNSHLSDTEVLDRALINGGSQEFQAKRQSLEGQARETFDSQILLNLRMAEAKPQFDEGLKSYAPGGNLNFAKVPSGEVQAQHGLSDSAVIGNAIMQGAGNPELGRMLVSGYGDQRAAIRKDFGEDVAATFDAQVLAQLRQSQGVEGSPFKPRTAGGLDMPMGPWTKSAPVGPIAERMPTGSPETSHVPARPFTPQVATVNPDGTITVGHQPMPRAPEATAGGEFRPMNLDPSVLAELFPPLVATVNPDGTTTISHQPMPTPQSASDTFKG